MQTNLLGSRCRAVTSGTPSKTFNLVVTVVFVESNTIICGVVDVDNGCTSVKDFCMLEMKLQDDE